LGQTVINGLTGLIYDDPITLWGSVVAIIATWLLVVADVLEGLWVGIVLISLVWLAIALSLFAAVRREKRAR
jgi:hypothetical protein